MNMFVTHIHIMYMYNKNDGLIQRFSVQNSLFLSENNIEIKKKYTYNSVRFLFASRTYILVGLKNGKKNCDICVKMLN